MSILKLVYFLKNLPVIFMSGSYNMLKAHVSIKFEEKNLKAFTSLNHTINTGLGITIAYRLVNVTSKVSSTYLRLIGRQLCGIS